MNYTYNNIKEQNDKRKEYLQFLDTKIANNKYLADKYNNSFYYQQMGMEQPKPPQRTTEEELLDFSKQREIAYTNLREITDTQSAAAILVRLTSLENIVEFNSYFGIFKEAIKGQSNITPSIFEILWREFRDKLSQEGRLISRLPRESELGAALEQELNLESLGLPPDYVKSDAIQDLQDEFGENADLLKTPAGQLEFMYKNAEKIFPEDFAKELQEFIYDESEKQIPEIVIDEVNKKAKPIIYNILMSEDAEGNTLIDSKQKAANIANRGVMAFVNFMVNYDVQRTLKLAIKGEKEQKKQLKSRERAAKKEVKARKIPLLQELVQKAGMRPKKGELITELKERREEIDQAMFNANAKALMRRAKTLITRFLPPNQREGALTNIARRIEVRGLEDTERFLNNYEQKEGQKRIMPRGEIERLIAERKPLIEGIKREEKEEKEEKEATDVNSESYRLLNFYLQNTGKGKMFKKIFEGESVDDIYESLPSEDEKLNFLAKIFYENYSRLYKSSNHTKFINNNMNILAPLAQRRSMSKLRRSSF